MTIKTQAHAEKNLGLGDKLADGIDQRRGSVCRIDVEVKALRVTTVTGNSISTYAPANGRIVLALVHVVETRVRTVTLTGKPKS